jgi:hypothetical protein
MPTLKPNVWWICQIGKYVREKQAKLLKNLFTMGFISTSARGMDKAYCTEENIKSNERKNL